MLVIVLEYFEHTIQTIATYITILKIYSSVEPILSVIYTLLHLIILFRKVGTSAISHIWRSSIVKGIKVPGREVRLYGSNLGHLNPGYHLAVGPCLNYEIPLHKLHLHWPKDLMC